MAFKVGELLAELQLDTGDFKAGMKTVREETKKLDRTLSTVGRKLTLGLSVPLAAVAVVSVKAAADMERLTLAMKAVTGSAANADREIKRLKETAKLPGLGFREAIQGSVRLQAAGFSADRARQALEAFGNAIALAGGGKRDLDLVTLALTQIAASGQLLGQELRQLQQRVPQIQQALIQAFGTARTEELQAMGIGADEFFDKITAVLGKLPRLTSGVANSFENLEDSIFRARVAIGNALLPVVIPLLDSVTRLAEALADSSENTRQWGVALGVVLAAAGPLLLLVSGMVTAFTALAAVLGVGLLPMIGVGGAIVLGLGALATVLAKVGLNALSASREVDSLTKSVEGLQASGFAEAMALLGISTPFDHSRIGGSDIPSPAAPTFAPGAGQLLDAITKTKDRLKDLKFELGLEMQADAAEKLKEEIAEASRRLSELRRQASRFGGESGLRALLGGGIDPSDPLGRRSVSTLRMGALGIPIDRVHDLGPGLAGGRGFGFAGTPGTPQAERFFNANQDGRGMRRAFRGGLDIKLFEVALSEGGKASKEFAAALRSVRTPLERFGGSLKDMGKGLLEQAKGLFDPKQIMSTVAGNLLTSGFQLVVGKIMEGLTGLFDRVDEQQKRLEEAIERNTKALQAGSDFLRRRVEGVGLGDFAGDALAGMEELLNRIAVGDNAGDPGQLRFQLIEMIRAGLPDMGLGEGIDNARARIAAALDTLARVLGIDISKLNEDVLHQFAEQISRTTTAAGALAKSFGDVLRNVPTGFKVALARFNATVPGTRGGGSVPPITDKHNPFQSFDPDMFHAKAAVTQNFQANSINIQGTGKTTEQLWRELQAIIQREAARGGTTTVTPSYERRRL